MRQARGGGGRGEELRRPYPTLLYSILSEVARAADSYSLVRTLDVEQAGEHSGRAKERGANQKQTCVAVEGGKREYRLEERGGKRGERQRRR